MSFRHHVYYSDMVDVPTCVYRLYDKSGELLYVGLSLNPEQRFIKHRRRPWWNAVTRAEFEWFEGREEAKAAERTAIHYEVPIHNIARPRMESY